jgi:hypothetical protein
MVLIPWIILGIFILLLWIFLGRKNYEFVGLRPFITGEPTVSDPSSPDYLKKYYEKKKKEQEEKRKDIEDVSFVDVRASYSTFQNEKEETEYELEPFKNRDPSEILRSTLRRDLYLKNSKWKMEAECRHILAEIYGKPFISVRPTWLKNPETNGLLELDCYNEELKIAAEYNGIQHYVFPNNLHKNYEEFISQVRRDQYKVKRCDQMGVYLITIPYTVPKNQIKNYIIHYLPENIQSRCTKKTTNISSKICAA